jgi:nucleotide-binding universal stress UspA family protein
VTPTSDIVVPLDGSATARNAITPALLIARRLGCRLELLTVYDPVRDTWERDLDGLAEQTGYGAAEVALVSSASPADVIISLARDQPGTLVCMATQGRGGMDRMLLGSVTSTVLAARISPVLLVGATYSPPEEPDRYRQLVIASDGTGRTVSAALPLIQQWVGALDLRVELLGVATPTSDGPTREVLEPAFASITENLTHSGIDAHCTIVTADHPAEGITAYVANHPHALVAVAPRGHTGLRRLLVGSVTAELLSSSPAPVLVLQETERHDRSAKKLGRARDT